MQGHKQTNPGFIASSPGGRWKLISSNMKNLKICALIATAMLCGPSARAADVFVPGVVKEEYFPGKSLADLNGGTAGTPASVTFLTTWETPVNFADNYSSRVSGVFIPPI